MTEFSLRPARADEFRTAIDWAAAEGWNPGHGDLEVFHATDPQGFIMGFKGDQPVSTISVVRYPGDFGFLGFYIVHPAHRGSGFGIATWHAGMAYLQGCTIGLDGVTAQQDNYRKSGFQLAGRNIRHTGRPARLGGKVAGVDIKPVTAEDLAYVCAYDAGHFPVRRETFIRPWVLANRAGAGRHSLAAWRDGKICGLGTVRACRAGYKIGPLFADDAALAEMLFDALTDTLPADTEVALDTPEDNLAALALAVRAGLQPVFETARMYCGADPKLPLQRIFGVTTFELG